MIAVVDTCYFLNRGSFSSTITKIFIPHSIKREMLNDESREHYNLHQYMIEIREPSESYIRQIEDLNEKLMLNLSSPDIEVVALTVELYDIYSNTWIDSTNINEVEDVFCLTMDNGVRQCLRYLGLYNDKKFETRRYKMRCFACFSVFDERLDFCKKCGLNTVTRVSVVTDENNNEKILLRKNYKFKPKTLYDNKGVELRSSGQREYEHFMKTKGFKNKKKALTDVLGDL
ncbi:hypothetical protein P3W45_000503 [Vairimorpha bombi]|jgi:RNA-binding protein NOB1